MIKLQKILTPTDFSEFSTHAFRYGCEFAKRFDAELHLLHIIDELMTLPDPLGAPVPDSQIRDMQHSAETAMQNLLDDDRLKGVNVAAHVIQIGAPFVSILEYARENEIDMIVMGTHGRTGLAHMMIGSTAERIVRKSPCPVLTVRPEEHDFVMP